jgi:hypothetical protein
MFLSRGLALLFEQSSEQDACFEGRSFFDLFAANTAANQILTLLAKGRGCIQKIGRAAASALRVHVPNQAIEGPLSASDVGVYANVWVTSFAVPA